MKQKKSILGIGFACSTVALGIMYYLKGRDLSESRANTIKYLSLFRTMNQYLLTKQMGLNIADWFRKNNYQTISIYGMSHMAQRIIDDLKKTEIQVRYGVDKRAGKITSEYEIYLPEEELPKVDAMIVTAFDFDDVYDLMSERVDFPIINVTDVLYNL